MNIALSYEYQDRPISDVCVDLIQAYASAICFRPTWYCINELLLRTCFPVGNDKDQMMTLERRRRIAYKDELIDND